MLENNRLIAEFLGWDNKMVTFDSLYDDEDCSSRERVYQTPFSVTTKTRILTSGKYRESSLKFHSDWNWLMLVIEKIESIVLPTLTIDLGYRECEFDNASFVMYISPIEVVIDIFGDMQREEKFIIANNHKDKITNTFEACVEFIKWYNEKR